MGGLIVVVAVLWLAIHFSVRQAVRTHMTRRIAASDDAPYAMAFERNTRFFQSIFRGTPSGWNSRTQRTTDEVIEQASSFVETLNDQFTNPSGHSVAAAESSPRPAISQS